MWEILEILTALAATYRGWGPIPLWMFLGVVTIGFIFGQGLGIGDANVWKLVDILTMLVFIGMAIIGRKPPIRYAGSRGKEKEGVSRPSLQQVSASTNVPTSPKVNPFQPSVSIPAPAPAPAPVSAPPEEPQTPEPPVDFLTSTADLPGNIPAMVDFPQHKDDVPVVPDLPTNASFGNPKTAPFGNSAYSAAVLKGVSPDQLRSFSRKVQQLYERAGHTVTSNSPTPVGDFDLSIHSRNGALWLARCFNGMDDSALPDLEALYQEAVTQKASRLMIFSTGEFSDTIKHWGTTHGVQMTTGSEFDRYEKG
jgi:hypothetical protein